MGAFDWRGVDPSDSRGGSLLTLSRASGIITGQKVGRASWGSGWSLFRDVLYPLKRSLKQYSEQLVSISFVAAS